MRDVIRHVLRISLLEVNTVIHSSWHKHWKQKWNIPQHHTSNPLDKASPDRIAAIKAIIRILTQQERE